MKVCVPVVENNGIGSMICDHFGSSPFFLIHDTDAGSSEIIPNSNAKHDHGMCHPLGVLAGYKLDAIICKGVGGGAIAKLNAAGIRVYLAQASEARAAIEAFSGKTLAEVTPDMACGHHGGCH